MWAVAEFLRAGLLTARAEAIWTTTEVNMHKAWRTHKEATDITRDLTVPAITSDMISALRTIDPAGADDTASSCTPCTLSR